MTIANTISDQYSNGNLLSSIEAAIQKLGKTPQSVTIDDLGPLDEFHIGGRQATAHLIEQLKLVPDDHVLDIGCGLGGAARFIATTINSRVTGVDATEEYIQTGRTLCNWVGMNGEVKLYHQSATAMSFEDQAFDSAYMLHVGMNIPDKVTAFREVYRLLKPGALFGIYDVMQTAQGEFAYPVPWADNDSLSFLGTSEEYKEALSDAGFIVSKITSRREVAIDFFDQMRARATAGDGPPPLGLHLLMRESTGPKVKNMIGNLEAGLIEPVEIIARKELLKLT
jgi:ubiquinone/menaquinone biosynthesis C-methylase UbiE